MGGRLRAERSFWIRSGHFTSKLSRKCEKCTFPAFFLVCIRFLLLPLLLFFAVCGIIYGVLLCEIAGLIPASQNGGNNVEGKKLISVVVPCYNEQEVLPMFYKEIRKISAQMQEKHPELEFEYLFIDDGSKDHTLRILRVMAKHDARVRYISFSRNFGKESGIYAGLSNAKGDYCVVMDADLQHPPKFLPIMYEAVSSGQYDCATTRRVSRAGESKVRSWFARLFYKIMNKISQTEIVDGAQDFRFMSRQMVDAVLSMTEYNRFSKGIFSWVGFRVKYLEYENVERAAGTTAWSFWGLFRYSLEGMIGFSTAPLSVSAIIGVITCLIGLIMFIITVIKKLAVGEAVAGYPTLICTMLFFGGLQLFCTGILGLYLGKTYLEVKHRPIYLKRETEEQAKSFPDSAEDDKIMMQLENAEYHEDPAAARRIAAAEKRAALEEKQAEDFVPAKAHQLKKEADKEFDAIVNSAMKEDTLQEDAPYSEESYDEADDGEIYEDTYKDDAAYEEDTYDAEAYEAPAEEPDEEPETAAPVKQEATKKEKFEVKIDYDSIDFDEDYEDDAAYDEEEPGYEDEEAYDEDAYEEDASYDEPEYEDGTYDESEYEEYDEYDEPEYSEKPVRRSAAPVQQGEGILDKIKGFFSGLIDKLNSDKQLEDYEAAIQAADEAADRAAQDEYDPDDDDADYDDYDDAADDEEDIHD
ncbi:MAG TPA: hypothetical protein DCG49_11460 [Ruminococcus sp.]|nr:hypothetical protein [Ruminococcus sp.]